MTDTRHARPSLWSRGTRYSVLRQKRSTKNLVRLCRENATERRTLVVHSEDVDYRPYFPNGYAVTKRPDKPADMHVDLYYRDLSSIADASYPVILCTGLLEHVPDPQRLIDEFHRILEPGGELIISASAVFSFHEGPNDFFHFTPFSFRLLFAQWTDIKVLRGASQPFETIGILMQRILLQCRIVPGIRQLVELLLLMVPILDKCIISQYSSVGTSDDEHRIDSMLPSNMQAVVIK
ncbi:MAG TPA: methyltransferase domain-containing protein [Candidatus Krumholzibacteria bacterium]|nr:methyltransferase domain-containing protein [Candidatus Krumholzibacteria bacterium]